MEGFFESIIYLLITAVILVLSMRKKRPVATEAEDDETGQKEDPFSDIFGEEDEQEYETVPKPATSAAGSAGAESYGGATPDSNPWMSEAEAKNMVMDADAVMKEAMDNNPIAQFEGMVKDDAYRTGGSDGDGVPFNLKKAVIYSEILNRREF